MATLTQQQQTILQQLGGQLEAVPGISAVVLGGSHARGRAQVDSDLDFGIYYRDDAPFNIDDIRSGCPGHCSRCGAYSNRLQIWQEFSIVHVRYPDHSSVAGPHPYKQENR